MKKPLAILLALGLATAVSSPAFACSWNKSASAKDQMTTASSGETVEHEAMSTFDPKALDENDLETVTPDAEIKIEE